MRAPPTVSVVIPTRNRPALVGRAVRTALAQSFADLEVIVVLDGPDEATAAALRSIDDPRLRVTVLETAMGSAGARNAGISEAQAPWVAFLDDDDEWMPDKIEIQVRTAVNSRLRFPIVSCRLLARSGVATFVWPRRTPRPGEHTSEYLFCRSSPFWGEGDLNTNTLLTKRELVVEVPFRTGLRRCIENDWLLRATSIDGTGIEFVETERPLTIWNMDDDRPRLTNTSDWRESLAWIRENRDLVTPRAYAGFVIGDVGIAAARRKQWAALIPLAKEAFVCGRPRWFDVALLGASWTLPVPLQDRLARRNAAALARYGYQDHILSRVLYRPLCRFYARHFLKDEPADSIYRLLCSLQYRWIYRRRPQFTRPQRFSEKIWSRMLHDRNPLLALVNDKARVREYVEQKVGRSYLIPLLWSGDRPEEIPFDDLPPAFVIKATHGCGFNVIVRDQKCLDRERTIRQLREWLGQNYCEDTMIGVEWAYRHIPPSIVIEELLGDTNIVPVDFKFYCFAGRVEFVMMHFDRFGDHVTKAFDRSFEPVEIGFHLPAINGPHPRPPRFDSMVSVAETLARDFDFIRVDLFAVGDAIYFGELTSYPGGVEARFYPENQDVAIGAKWKMEDVCGVTRHCGDVDGHSVAEPATRKRG